MLVELHVGLVSFATPSVDCAECASRSVMLEYDYRNYRCQLALQHSSGQAMLVLACQPRQDEQHFRCRPVSHLHRSQRLFNPGDLLMESLVRRALDLHSDSGVARKVLNLMQKDEYSADDLRNCIEKDPALAIRVLATANSARYGVHRRISNVELAVALLGRRNLRTIVLAFSVVERLTRGMDARVYVDYWKRSITTSIVADALARFANNSTAKDDACTAGLLADVGVLVLTQFESRRYLPLHEKYQHGRALVEAERQEFGFDHAALGAKILEVWKFPSDLVMAVGAHHDDDKSDRLPLASFVRAGNLLPAAIWIADSDAFHEAHAYVRTRFDFNIDQFLSLAIDANELVEDEAKTYGVTGIEAVDCEALQKEARSLLESQVCEQ